MVVELGFLKIWEKNNEYQKVRYFDNNFILIRFLYLISYLLICRGVNMWPPPQGLYLDEWFNVFYPSGK